MENASNTTAMPVNKPSPYRMSDSVLKITPALVKAQKKIKHAEKDGTNSHMGNQYATIASVIDAVKDPLLENDIVILQFVSKQSVVTRLQHTSGEYFEVELELIVNKNDMQGLGSAITYARRYTLASLLNIAQKDDDGNLASIASTKSSSKPAPKKVIATKDSEF